MQDLNDEQFDEMLHGHLSRELDGQVGRAREAFAAARPQSRARIMPRIALWGSLAAAAAIAGIVLRPGVPNPLPIVRVPAAPTVNVDYQVETQTIDQGTVFLDPDTPAHRYVQRQIETARWIDPVTHEETEVTVPQDHVLLVGLTTH